MDRNLRQTNPGAEPRRHHPVFGVRVFVFGIRGQYSGSDPICSALLSALGDAELKPQVTAPVEGVAQEVDVAHVHGLFIARSDFVHGGSGK